MEFQSEAVRKCKGTPDRPCCFHLRLFAFIRGYPSLHSWSVVQVAQVAMLEGLGEIDLLARHGRSRGGVAVLETVQTIWTAGYRFGDVAAAAEGVRSR